ncbi:hypothetical protein THIAE_02805 [Thiomicrospira aerophila AL3]|uniref:Uncharacterized protein n=1 Tax=Thiomicrospira aerophila AL3 TaxID=717772 RepID=W0DZE2_9GAMM|nr:hypothetical protein THIAE_02805 [Thiomicrospira aerophila AL3]
MNGIKAIIWGIILTFGSITLIWLLSLLTVVST